MNLAKRIGALERQIDPKRTPRLIIRFLNGGPGLSSEQDEEIEHDDQVLDVVFVEAKDGRPVKPTTRRR